MERGSGKHSPRIDDLMDEETQSLQRGAPVEARVEEFLEKEGPGDEDAVADLRGGEGEAGAKSYDDRQQ